jgi:hypothetical protein
MRHIYGVILPLLIASCASHSQYRAVNSNHLPPITVETLEKRADIPGTNECSEKALRQDSIERFRTGHGDVFTLGVIELSDDGHIKNVRQRDEVFAELRRVALENNQGAVIVTFVHGWHHVAKVCDENLSCYRRVLLGLAEGKGQRANKGPIFGIYVGWRGESAHHLTAFTFYNRKATAHHVGGVGGRDLLLDLNQLRGELDREVRARSGGQHYVSMVTVGHSFGGALVYSAMESIGVHEYGRTPDNEHAIHGVGETARNGVLPLRSGIGDLVVLVNPAFEAWRYRYFADDVAAGERYSTEQRPVLLTVASQADQAVGMAFPAGRTLWLPFHPTAWPHARAEVTGLGHYSPHTTHDLVFSGQPDQPAPASPLTDQTTLQHCGLEKELQEGLVRDKCDCSYSFYEQMTGGRAGTSDDPAGLRAGEGSVYVEKDQLVTLKRRRGVPYAPYIVASAPANLISGHSDIYNPNFILFLIGYVNANLPQAGEAQAADAQRSGTAP